MHAFSSAKNILKIIYEHALKTNWKNIYYSKVKVPKLSPPSLEKKKKEVSINFDYMVPGCIESRKIREVKLEALY